MSDVPDKKPVTKTRWFGPPYVLVTESFSFDGVAFFEGERFTPDSDLAQRILAEHSGTYVKLTSDPEPEY